MRNKKLYGVSVRVQSAYSPVFEDAIEQLLPSRENTDRGGNE